MKRVKITVLKTTLGQGTGCGVWRGGTDRLSHAESRPGVLRPDYAKPEGWCDEAWRRSISMYFFGPRSGTDLFY